MPETKQGIVTEIEFRDATGKRHVTTIGGRLYATDYDVRAVDWQLGDHIAFEVGAHGFGLPKAVNLRKLTAIGPVDV